MGDDGTHRAFVLGLASPSARSKRAQHTFRSSALCLTKLPITQYMNSPEHPATLDDVLAYCAERIVRDLHEQARRPGVEAAVAAGAGRPGRDDDAIHAWMARFRPPSAGPTAPQPGRTGRDAA
jgi:hypothetical protein